LKVERALAVALLVQLLASVVLVFLMAAKSPIDAHPDEMLHLLAGRYFQTHWLPPPVGAPQTAGSYSLWGFSYLDMGDVAHWLLGKAAAAGALFRATPAVAMRSLQVLLYVALVVWCLARARTFVPALGFLLLTPQLWYVFSYINADALPFLLFTGLILELGWPESGIRAFWRSREAGPTAGVFAVGVLLGLLLTSKLNYLVGVVFLGVILVWLRGEITHWKRLTVPIAVAVAIAAPWSCYHAWINDFQTNTKVAAYAAFERAANEDLERSVGSAIERTLRQALPANDRSYTPGQAGAQRAAPLHEKLASSIRVDVEKALQGDRQLGEQVAQILSSRRLDNESRSQIVRLISERAQQLVPGAAKRVLNEWTQTTLAAHRGRTERADAASARTDVPLASAPARSGANDQANPRRQDVPRGSGQISTTKSHTVNYRKLSDEQILEM